MLERYTFPRPVLNPDSVNRKIKAIFDKERKEYKVQKEYRRYMTDLDDVKQIFREIGPILKVKIPNVIKRAEA